MQILVLVLVEQDVRKGKNVSNAEVVRSGLPPVAAEGYTKGITKASSHSNVTFAPKNFFAKITSGIMRGYTAAKNHFSVIFAAKDLTSIQSYSITRGLT